ncbi:Protein SPIRAL1-like 2, partial [Mucuna pruriens]
MQPRLSLLTPEKPDDRNCGYRLINWPQDEENCSSKTVKSGNQAETKTVSFRNQLKSMGRGVSSGGGQSSLGYLFGSGEAPTPKPATNNAQPEVQAVNNAPPSKPAAAAPKTFDPNKPAGINSHSTDGQNTGNFITDRPSTKVHAAPGGGSSLGYLFGGPGEGK